MTAKARILAFAGSARTGSFNKKLVRIAAAGAEKAGAEVTLIDLRDLEMPLFDADLEKRDGMPENARRFKELVTEHDALLISSPENNSSVSALLKNAIDWASRSYGDEPRLGAYRGKVAAIMATAPGALGGLRGLVHLRAILGNLGVLVIPDQRAVPKAREAFADDGSLKDSELQEKVEALGAKLFEIASRLKP